MAGVPQGAARGEPLVIVPSTAVETMGVGGVLGTAAIAGKPPAEPHWPGAGRTLRPDARDKCMHVHV